MLFIHISLEFSQLNIVIHFKFIFRMSLKYRRSIIFDKPEQTTAKMTLQTIVYDCKERIKINSRAHSQINRHSPERLTVAQVKCIEGLQSKLKTISFHKLYKQYHQNAGKEEEGKINPERLEMFRSGKFYRCTQRPREEEVNIKTQNIKKGLKEYYYRHPEEQNNLQTRKEVKRSVLSQLGRIKASRSCKKI